MLFSFNFCSRQTELKVIQWFNLFVLIYTKFKDFIQEKEVEIDGVKVKVKHFDTDEISFKKNHPHKVEIELYSDDNCKNLVSSCMGYFKNEIALYDDPLKKGISNLASDIDVSKLTNGILKLKYFNVPMAFSIMGNNVEKDPEDIKFYYSYLDKGVWSEYKLIGQVTGNLDVIRYDWNVKDLPGGKYRIKAVAKYSGQLAGEEISDVSIVRLYHGLTILAPFGSIYTKPANKDAKGISPNPNPPLNEIDTLAVRILKTDLSKWGPLVPFAKKESGSVVLQSEFSNSNLITKDDGDYVIHKYPFLATGLDEGNYYFGVRFEKDTASFAQNKVHVATQM